jgi:hypothetical protein
MAINIKPENKGKLHKALGVAQGSKIPAGKIAKAKKSESPALRKEATFAQNARHWHHTKQPKEVSTDRGKFGMK